MPRKKHDAVGVSPRSMDRFLVVREHPAFNARSAIPETARQGDAQAGLPRPGEAEASLGEHSS